MSFFISGLHFTQTSNIDAIADFNLTTCMPVPTQHSEITVTNPFPNANSIVVKIYLNGPDITCDLPVVLVYVNHKCFSKSKSQCELYSSRKLKDAVTRCSYRCFCPASACGHVTLRLYSAPWLSTETHFWQICEFYVMLNSRIVIHLILQHFIQRHSVPVQTGKVCTNKYDHSHNQLPAC